MTPNINPYNENKGGTENTTKTKVPQNIHRTHNVSAETRVNKHKNTGRVESKTKIRKSEMDNSTLRILKQPNKAKSRKSRKNHTQQNKSDIGESYSKVKTIPGYYRTI